MIYLPYPNLQIDWNSDKSGFMLSLPWIMLEIETLAEDLPWIEKAINFLHLDQTHEAVQRFLSQLKEYNVAYIAPRILPDKTLSMKDDKISDLSPEILQTPREFAQEIDTEASLALNIQLSPRWQWNVEEVYQACQIADTQFYDPLTLISYLQGYMLQSDALTDEFRTTIPSLLDQLRQMNEPAFFSFMKMMLRQTHYITACFQKYAPLSLQTFPEAEEEIEDFLREEKGHDKLMEHSLKVLGVDVPETISVLPENILLISLFKAAIERCPLAFTAMVGFFEGGEYGETDPIADVLKKSSLPQSALGYERHFEINKAGNHNEVIQDLAKKLPLQTRESVAFTTRLLELAAYIGSASDKYLVSVLQTAHSERNSLQ
jgi:hypothetical protein